LHASALISRLLRYYGIKRYADKGEWDGVETCRYIRGGYRSIHGRGPSCEGGDGKGNGEETDGVCGAKPGAGAEDAGRQLRRGLHLWCILLVSYDTTANRLSCCEVLLSYDTMCDRHCEP
jgi:hypothetical protein